MPKNPAGQTHATAAVQTLSCERSGASWPKIFAHLSSANCAWWVQHILDMVDVDDGPGPGSG